MFAMNANCRIFKSRHYLRASGVIPVVELNTIGVCSEHCGNRSLSVIHDMISSTLKVEKERTLYYELES